MLGAPTKYDCCSEHLTRNQLICVTVCPMANHYSARCFHRVHARLVFGLHCLAGPTFSCAQDTGCGGLRLSPPVSRADV